MSVLAWIEATAAQQQDQVALYSAGAAWMSYAQLACAVSELSSTLLQLSVEEDLIALYFPRYSPGYVVAMLAVWKAGCAFVPLDPDLPLARMRHILADCAPRMVLTLNTDRMHAAVHELCSGSSLATAKILQAGSSTLLSLAGDHALPRHLPEFNESRLAYIIYTSGSTGKPKGVMVEHRGVHAFVSAQVATFLLNPQSRVLQALSTNFDAHVSDVCTALASGASLFVESHALIEDSRSLVELLHQHRITHTDLAPSLLPVLDLDAVPSSLRVVVIGGEVCPAPTVRLWASRMRVVNVYGPTECTVCSSMIVCTPQWQRPLIGDPVPGTKFHVLDAQRNKITAIGAVGELHISGIGVARGYFNEPRLTAEKFVQLHNERAYRTGDLVRITDTSPEFLGRIDRQVKLSGILVEPFEVEQCIRCHVDVADACVVPSSSTLHAFVLLKPNAARPALREFLRASLPHYMQPHRINFVSSLPKNVNGKTDFAWLTQHCASTQVEGEVESESEAGDEIEAVIANVFASTLAIDATPQIDFFELGSSIDALRLVAAANARGIPLSLELLRVHATPRAIAQALRSAEIGRDSATLREIASAHNTIALFANREAQAASHAILVVGSAGFLGRHVLDRLIDSFPDSTIYSLARSVQPHANSRVRSLCGDASATHFGLSSETWNELAENVSLIVNCAGSVNLSATLEMLLSPNVDTLRNVLHLAATGVRKRVLHCSTLSVLLDTSNRTSKLFEDVSTLDLEQKVFGGYAQSKWIAEWLIRECARAGVRDLCIVRLGLLTGHSEDGTPSDRFDLLSKFFVGLNQIGSAPAQLVNLEIDLTPVDYAARAIAALAQRDLEANAGEPFVLNVANQQAGTLGAIVDAMRDCGLFIKCVELARWRSTALSLSEHEASAASMLSLCHALAPRSFAALRPVDLFRRTGSEFVLDNLARVLHERCPSPQTLLPLYVMHLIRSNAFLATPRPRDLRKLPEQRIPQHGVTPGERWLARAVFYNEFYLKPSEVPEIISFLYSIAHPIPDCALLDIGCGTGRLLRAMLASGWRVHACEPDADYFEFARANSRGATLTQRGFEQIDECEAYHIITAVNGPLLYLKSARERRDALARCFRALRRNGVLLIDIPNFLFLLKHYRAPEQPVQRQIGELTVTHQVQHQWDFSEALWTHHELVTVQRGEDTQRYHDVYTFAMVSWPELREMLHQCGFIDLQTFPTWRSRTPSPLTGYRMVIVARKPV